MLKLSDSFLTKLMLYGDSKYSHTQNHEIVNSTIIYILGSERFDCSVV